MLKFPPPIPNSESWLIAAIVRQWESWNSWQSRAVGKAEPKSLFLWPKRQKLTLKIYKLFVCRYAMVKIEWCNYCIFACNVFAVINVHAYIYIYKNTQIYLIIFLLFWWFQRIWKNISRIGHLPRLYIFGWHCGTVKSPQKSIPMWVKLPVNLSGGLEKHHFFK